MGAFPAGAAAVGDDGGAVDTPTQGTEEMLGMHYKYKTVITSIPVE